MWVIKTKWVVMNEIYQVGYYIELNEILQFEVFDSFEDKLEAMKCCHYLNGGS